MPGGLAPLESAPARRTPLADFPAGGPQACRHNQRLLAVAATLKRVHMLRREFLVMMDFQLTEIINLAGLTQLGNQEAVRTNGGGGHGQRDSYSGNRHSLFIAQGFRPATTARQATGIDGGNMLSSRRQSPGNTVGRALVLARATDLS